MEIPREYFHWYIADGFYRRKYSLGIYRGNYSGKKKLKQSKKNDDVPFLPMELPKK
jgi:hypothetical protein